MSIFNLTSVGIYYTCKNGNNVKRDKNKNTFINVFASKVFFVGFPLSACYFDYDF